MNKNKFESASYEKHSIYFTQHAAGEAGHHHARSWLDKDSVDSWRHERFFSVLSPLLAVCPDAKWLTVGDGRYGNDAQWLQRKGSEVTASDISGVLLEEAFAAGMLKSYSIENAECLSFPDNSFDFVLCKDSYHHFPRPMYALYELLRVAREGVVLIEPSDHIIANLPMDKWQLRIRELVRKVLGKPVNISREYEVLGNYVYRLSRREIEKVALGLNYPYVAFKGMNDYYHEAMLDEKVVDNGKWFRKAKLIISVLDILYRLRLRDCRILTAIIFKNEISERLRLAMVDEGYEVVKLTRNPYV